MGRTRSGSPKPNISSLGGPPHRAAMEGKAMVVTMSREDRGRAKCRPQLVLR